MSKKAKTAAAERRKKDKRSRKDAQQAKYEAWSKAGSNKKKKQSRGGNLDGRKSKHEVLFCGNIGCLKCGKPRLPKPAPIQCIARISSRKDGSTTMKFTFLNVDTVAA